MKTTSKKWKMATSLNKTRRPTCLKLRTSLPLRLAPRRVLCAISKILGLHPSETDRGIGTGIRKIRCASRVTEFWNIHEDARALKLNRLYFRYVSVGYRR